MELRETIKALPTPIGDLLPKGAINELSEKHGIARQNVAAILRGEWENRSVIEGALQLIKNNIRNQGELVSSLESALVFHEIRSAAGS